MRIVPTALIFPGGLFFLATTAGFLLNPVPSGGNFGLSASRPHGLASIRAAISAFCAVAAMCMTISAR